MKIITGLYLFVFVFLTNVNSFGQYALDWSFNSSGTILESFPAGLDDYGQGITTQPDGKIIVCGRTGDSLGFNLVVLRYDTNGLPDSTFDVDGKVVLVDSDIATFCSAVIVQPDGKILLGGYSSSLADFDHFMVRLFPDGSLDSSFDGDGIVKIDLDSGVNDGIRSIALQPDGKIITAGYTSFSMYLMTPAVFRFNADGSLDTTFNAPDFPMAYDQGSIFSVVVQSDGKIVVAGSLNYAFTLGIEKAILARYNADGSFDSSFNGTGYLETDFGSTNASGNLLALQTDGKLLLGGYAQSSVSAFGLLRVNTDGTLDISFGTGGKLIVNPGPTGGGMSSINLQSDGKIVAAGSAYVGSPYMDFALLRFNINGTLDNTFGTGGKIITDLGLGTDERIYAACMQTDGKIVVTGSINDSTFSHADIIVARYHANAVGIDESKNENEFSVYPNPVSDQLTISSKTTFRNAKVRLIDISGQLVLAKQNINGNNFTIDVSSQTAGMYVVEVSEGETVSRIKLVKQ